MSTTAMSLPLAPGTWGLDPVHCTVEFTVRHLAISKVRGRFSTFDAELVVGDRLESSSLRAVVDLSSVDTNNPDRDAHLRGSDFFNTESNPQMVFQSTSIIQTNPGHYLVTGDLSINGVSHSETLDVSFNGTEVYPMDGSVHAGFEARSTINRKDYGVSFNVPMGAGGFVISDKIGVELDIQLVSLLS
jgi:polyisoprenoid-binding protein YceI